MILSPNEVAWLAEHVGGWVGDDAIVAVAVARAESAFDTDALNMSHPPNVDHGLFQISSRWHGDKLRRFRWRDPYDNVRMARLVFDEFVRRPEGNGWLAWTVYNSGAYLTHMDLATLAFHNPVEPINVHTTGWRR